MTKLRVRQISESEFTVKGHGVHTAYIETVRALQRNTNLEVATNRRGVADITHIHTVGLYSVYYLLFGSGKKVVSAHIVPNSFVGSLIAAKAWQPVAKLYLRWFYNRADVVLAVSDETARELIDLGVKKPIELVHNMVDTSRYVPSAKSRALARQQLGIADDARVVVGAGQVQPRKRVDVFMNLARIRPAWTLCWVGGMPFGKLAADHRKMQQLIDESPDNLQITGVVDLDQVRQYYHAADVFLLPSEQETFGLVVVEAAAAGLPVVLRDLPDYDATFRPFAELTNDDGFVAVLDKLLTDDKHFKMQQAQSKQLAKQFDSATGVDRLMTIYKGLL